MAAIKNDKNDNLEGRVYLAPMSPYTNLPFRLLCQKYGAQGAVIPLISAEEVRKGSRKINELDPNPAERFVGVQLYGAKPEDIGHASKIITENHPFIKFIDINCSYFASEAMRSGAGAALLRKPESVVQMIESAAKSGKPITVKIRKMDNDEEMLSFCRAIENAAGLKAIFFHGRTPNQGNSGEADWKIIKMISKGISIPVVGSGSIKSMEQGRIRIKEAGCSSFMVGRAAMADPGIFSSPKDTTHERKRRLFMEYLELCREFDCLRMPDLKSKATQILSGFIKCEVIQARIGKAMTENELIRAIE